MKKLNLIVAFLATVITVSTFAQISGNEEKDPKAKAILDKLSKKNNELKSVKIDFSYNLQNTAEKIDETQKGSVSLKGNKFILDIAGQTIINNSKTQWTYIKDADEVQIDNAPDPASKDNALNPAEIFTIYETGFKYKYEKEDKYKEKAVDIIKLYPLDANKKSYHTIILAVYKVENQFAYIKILSKDGNKYTYYLDKFTPNPALTDTDFNFDVSKVGEVIDLR